MATLLMRATDGGSADKKRRARKGKNAQKKQPQRGLGVAQLEKLRLQEQSLLCPSPSYSLRLCNPPDHPMARCDSDVAQTVLSLTNVPGSNVRDTGVARLALNGHSSTQTLPAQDKSNETVDAKRVTSRALACLNQSSKFSSANASFFSNVLTTTPLQIYDGQGQVQKYEERRAGPGETSNPAVYIFSTIHNVKEPGAQVNDGGFKLHPVFKDVQRIPLPLTDPHYLETLLVPDGPHLPRKRMESPVVGLSPSVEKTKELSSFQSYQSNNQTWSSPDKASGIKRPWVATQENDRQSTQSQALDLNAPAGENEASHVERHSPRLNQVAENRVGAHYTTGIVRSALGNSCLPLAKMKACSSVPPWQDNESPSSASGFLSDVGMNPENGLLVKQCTSPSTAKDSSSSASGPTGYLNLKRNRSLNDPETLLQAGKESICSSNFLTLGITSSSYPGSGWLEADEGTQDTSMSMNNVGRLKQGSTSGCDRDDAAQLRKSVCKQEFGTLDLDRSKTFLADCGGQKRSCPLIQSESVHSSHHSNMLTFPSTSPSSTNNNTADKCPPCNQSPRCARVEEEDILDLRLKLAL